MLSMVLINDPSSSSFLPVNKFFVSFLITIQSIVSVSGRISPQLWDAFHKPTISLFVSLLVFQQFRFNLLGRVLSKLICGRSCHFLLNSFLSFDHSFVTGVLHGGSTWWFIKDLIPFRSVHRDSFQRSSCILHLAIRSAILSRISFEVVLCLSW